jgi:hypothetical protein
MVELYLGMVIDCDPNVSSQNDRVLKNLVQK